MSIRSRAFLLCLIFQGTLTDASAESSLYEDGSLLPGDIETLVTYERASDEISDSVFIDNREWLQPVNFTGYSYDEISEVCANEECSGSLQANSTDLSGYHWASSEDVSSIFDSYQLAGKQLLNDFEYTSAEGNPVANFSLYGLVSDVPDSGVYVATAYDGEPNNPYNEETFSVGPTPIHASEGSNDLGAWFYRLYDESGFSFGGSVKTAQGLDICALVLASGRVSFSCEPPGRYSLINLSTEPDGTVVRQIYASGFFPKVDVLRESTWEQVTLERASNCTDYNLPLDPLDVPQSSGQRHSVTGRVLLQNTDMPVCALVLANGSYVFSCDEEGSFSLDFPLDENGQYTLQTYAIGFAPWIQTFDEFSNVQEVRMARASECKSGDFPNIVEVDGRDWLQPDLFTGLSRDEIYAACPPPQDLCIGSLNGYDVHGWKWASLDDVSDLLVALDGPGLTYPPAIHDGGTGSEWAPAFFELGFRSNFESAGRAHIALTSTFGGDCTAFPAICSVEVRIVDRADDTVPDFVELGTREGPQESLGAWLYRPQSTLP